MFYPFADISSCHLDAGKRFDEHQRNTHQRPFIFQLVRNRSYRSGNSLRKKGHVQIIFHFSDKEEQTKQRLVFVTWNDKWQQTIWHLWSGYIETEEDQWGIFYIKCPEHGNMCSKWQMLYLFCYFKNKRTHTLKQPKRTIFDIALTMQFTLLLCNFSWVKKSGFKSDSVLHLDVSQNWGHVTWS